MFLIDTHSHIYQENFNEDRDFVISQAKLKGVGKILLPNIDRDSILPMQCACQQYPDYCYPMMGLHPTSIDANYESELNHIYTQFKDSSFQHIAVGEIGLDVYWDKTFLKEQISAFEEQLQWSIDLNLPVVIHSRDAHSLVMESIHKIGTHQLKGVFHSFGGNEDELQEILELDNFMIGINGVVTFKNSTLRQYLNQAPLDRIVLETDAPYLAPIPYRGKRNEPSYIVEVAKKLSEIYNISVDEIAAQTTKNAKQLFKI